MLDSREVLGRVVSGLITAGTVTLVAMIAGANGAWPAWIVAGLASAVTSTVLILFTENGRKRLVKDLAKAKENGRKAADAAEAEGKRAAAAARADFEQAVTAAREAREAAQRVDAAAHAAALVRWSPQQALLVQIGNFAEVGKRGRALFAQLEVYNFSPYTWRLTRIKAFSLSIKGQEHVVSPVLLSDSLPHDVAPGARTAVELVLPDHAAKTFQVAIRNAKDQLWLWLEGLEMDVTRQEDNREFLKVQPRTGGRLGVFAHVKDVAP